MKITVWTLTTEGDNCPLTTEVFATETECYSELAAMLQQDVDCNGMTPEQMEDAWVSYNDGPCCIEQHTVEIAA